MPAKKEYIPTPLPALAKLAAALVGGYCISVSLHVLIAILTKQRETVMFSATFTLFLVWAVVMVLTFLARTAWKIWTLYICLTLLFAALIYVLK
jgi:hypothetical protein